MAYTLPTADLTGRHWIALLATIGGVDFLWNPEPEVARLSTARRHALIGEADHELVQRVGEVAPELVTVCPPMGRNPHAILGAKLTSLGMAAVAAYLQSRPWKLNPESGDPQELLTNYNLFLRLETTWDPIDLSQFLAYANGEVFRQRWAPRLVVASES